MARRERFPEQVYEKSAVLLAEQYSKAGILVSIGPKEGFKAGTPLLDGRNNPINVRDLTIDQLTSFKSRFASIAAVDYGNKYRQELRLADEDGEDISRMSSSRPVRQAFLISGGVAAVSSITTHTLIEQQNGRQDLSIPEIGTTAASTSTLAVSGALCLGIAHFYAMYRASQALHNLKAKWAVKDFVGPAIASENADTCREEIFKRRELTRHNDLG